MANLKWFNVISGAVFLILGLLDLIFLDKITTFQVYRWEKVFHHKPSKWAHLVIMGLGGIGFVVGGILIILGRFGDV